MPPNQPYPSNQQFPIYPMYPPGQQPPAPSFPPAFELPTSPGSARGNLRLSPARPATPIVSGWQAPPSQPPQQSPAIPPRKARTWPAILLFCLFAALIPETLVTSSTSVLKIVTQPLSLPFIMLFYGMADLVIREALIRRTLGLASLLLLGIAFGFVNEGVVAGTWYTVHPTGYAFYGGIDWLWALGLTIFHLLISVIMPIVFFDILFPQFARRPLLRRRGLIISTILFLAVSSLVFFTPHYRLERLVVFLIAIALALIALRLPSAQPLTPISRAVPGLWRLRILGFVAMLVYFASLYLTPFLLWIILKHMSRGLLLTQIISAVLLLTLTWYALALAYGWSQHMGWSARHSLAVISGALTFTLVISVLFERAALEPFATIPFFALLVWLAWHTRRKSPALVTPSSVPLS